ncbi:hypothetical protein OOU_Y34scaffold01011g3 [Pyricularia oryzae Y34]|uniref:DDE-1 domain-containing protein n=2 Tax=Pyricularia oryzae TaxID=318829 RepID=A0AA97NML8_PYRO3|nr:hypothetical protein OOU_Y34scaffold01011g3 [Pyricularia oryzae Y34]
MAGIQYFNMRTVVTECSASASSKQPYKHLWISSSSLRQEMSHLLVAGINRYSKIYLFDIEIVILPPHSTHYMQRMDVSVFTHLENELQVILHEHIQSGIPQFSRSDFVAATRACFQSTAPKCSSNCVVTPLQRILRDTQTLFLPLTNFHGLNMLQALWWLRRSDTVDALSDLQAVANEAIILWQRVVQEQKNK